MADRPDLPRIKPAQQPTYFNREAGGWAFLGSFVGTLVGLAASAKEITRTNGASGKTKFFAIALGTEAIAAVFGAIKGKTRQEREQVEGRVVKDPTYLNSGFFSGAIVGGLITFPIDLLLEKAKVSRSVTGTIGQIGLWGGGALGLKIRKDSQQHDYDQAIGLRQQEIGVMKDKLHKMERTVQPHPASFKDSVSADESALLEAKQKTGGHADRAAAQEPVEAIR
jgi:hypothetical protein